MKIAIIATHILSDDSGSGGDVLFIQLARRWQRQGVDVKVLIAAAGARGYGQTLHPAKSIVLKGTWLDTPQHYFGRSLVIALVYLGRARRAIPIVHRLQADIIYTPGDFWCDVLPATFKKARQPGVVWAAAIFHINEPPFRRRGNSLLASTLSWMAQRASFFLMKRWADIIFALNHSVRETLIQRNFQPERIHVLGAGVDKTSLEKIPDYPSRYAACYVGRINPTKGVFELPAIWKRVVEAVPGSQLVMIGKASKAWEKQLQRAIAQAGMQGSMIYTGYVSSTRETHRYLKQSRLFITASTEEGFGISIAEAMTLGRPAVAYDVPVYHEFFPAGLTLIPPGEPTAFANAIIKLLTDQELYEAQSTAASRMAAAYDWDQVASAELKIMEQARRVC